MAVESSLGPGVQNDLEEIYYSIDSGVTVLLAWRRWIIGTDGTLTSTIVDNTGAIIVGAVEYPPPASATGALTNAQLRATPVPVSGPLTDAQIRATPLSVTGSFTVTGGLTNTEIRATPLPVNGTVSVGNFPASQAVTGPATDAQLRATPLPVSGTVSVSGTIPVSGPLTDTQLRATPVPVSANQTLATAAFEKITDGTNIVAVKPASTAALASDPAIVVTMSPNSPSTSGGLTDTQLRALPVPVSGTIIATGPLTDSQLRATPVPITGAVTGPLTDTQLRATPVPVSGPLTDTQLRAASVAVTANQTLATASFEKITDGTNTVAVKAPSTAPVATDSALVVTISPNSPAPALGLTDIQLRATAVPVSGTVAVSGSVAVTGPLTDAQIRAAALPISGTVTALGPLTDTQLRASVVPVSFTSSIASPVFDKITDGTNVITIKPSTTAPTTADTALVVTISPNSPATPIGLTDTQLRATPVPVSGTVAFSNATLAVTGPLTDTQLRASAVPVTAIVTSTTGLTDTQLRATPVPISGNVTVNIGLTDTQLRASRVPTNSQLTDGTTIATVKPASTPAVATDTSIVVSLSPNNPVTTTGLTDAQLRATAVPVSIPALLTGTNTIGNVNQTLATAEFAKITDGTNTSAVKAASVAPLATDPALVVALSPNSLINSTLATSAFSKITDGTNTAAVKAASVAAVATDPALVVAISPNNPITTTPAAFVTVTDIASAALTTTTTTAAITPSGGNSYIVTIPVTVVSGTTPTLDFNIEESDDTGTNWFLVYSFPRIIAAGAYRSPKIPYSGNRIRYVQTVGGTTPSFTRSIVRNQFNDTPDAIRQLIDRTIVLTTLNSVSPSLDTKRTKNIQIVASFVSSTTNPVLAIETSEDNGATWSILNTVNITGLIGQATFNNINSSLTRIRVSTAGVATVNNYILLKGW
jgi:hypothetical protein